VEQALRREVPKSPPALLAAYAVGFSVLHLVANLAGWYLTCPWFDIPMHVGGGIWVAWAALEFGRRFEELARLQPWMTVLALFGAAALVGSLWELWEAAGDAWLLAQGLPLAGIAAGFSAAPFNDRLDTLFDLVNDLVGAGIVSAAYLALRDRRAS